MAQQGIEAYNVKSKSKEVMKDAVIDITSNGRYFAKGKSPSNGITLCSAMGEEKAKAAIKAGWAKKGTGWQ